ncbi:pyruvate kinase [Anaerotalea alkaliphila]|uniref:Pyruvate kinase n=1 Tax=Anaerotalea alkaliphila TaxID=2662126 RepID=A0A7X5HTU9_9FIRM|nr:pyruvate kinase [Anaerotalea alkaliphila]NDL66549.1 pyruvate kinase [Anaerotalea alkaliphila]
MTKTKIICTIGPACDNKETLSQLVLNGLSIARINLSHNTGDTAKVMIDLIKEVREELGEPVAILLDTRGPEIRTKDFVNGSVELQSGQMITVSNGDFEGTEHAFCVNYPELYKDVKVGSSILVDDGLIEMEVVAIEGTDIQCLVKNGGTVKNKKGVNVPNISLQLPILSEQDRENMKFAVEQDVDFIAASFIRNAQDVLEIRALLDQHGGQGIKIISKIENQEGLDNIDAIIEASDAIMVARGDLGVEIPPERIPVAQKTIIEKCNKAATPVITATQMLESMIKNPRPTRAEVSDVANAVLDGTDAIMLSGETAAGAYPVNAVSIMRKIAASAEETIDYELVFQKIVSMREKSVTNAVSYATCSTAMYLGAKAIISPTVSGRTALMLSMFRPKVPVFATTTNAQTQRQMQLYWGVKPILMMKESSSDILFYKSVEVAKKMGYLKSQDLVVITAGVPLGVTGKTNLMKVQEVD